MSKETPTIQLIPVRKAGGAFDHWQMSLNNGPPKDPGAYPPVAVGAQNSADFSYTIVNANGITFSADPIWIQKGTAKPTKSGVDVIKNISGQNTTTLKFHDGNKDAGTLTYVLNFNGAPQLDPIITNGGGGPGVVRDLAWPVIGGVAVALLLFLLLRPLFRKQRVEEERSNP